MKKTLLGIAICFFLGTVSGNAQDFIQHYADVANQVTQDNITNNLTEFESLGVKRKGTAALQNTLNWLKDKYLSYGYTAGQMVEDSYSYSGYTCKNLVLTKIGTVHPNTYVIVCGHYDTIAGTGTNDNGSGTSIILEIARLLQNVPTEYSIKFINFSGEEDGLRGSQHYVTSVVNGTNPKMDIKVVFNIDEVGGVAGMNNDTITCDVDQSTPTTNNAASAQVTDELAACVSLYSPLNTFINYADATDYIPFENNNEIITGFYETNISNHPHTTSDTLANMDPEYVFNVGKAAVGATMHFAVAATALSNEEFATDFQVSLFPNPAKGKLNINFGTLKQDNYTFSLLDVQGKKVVQNTINNGVQLQTVDVSRVSSGIYLGVLESAENRITKKIVIE
ncbi:M28 family peptidase [Flavobacterium sp. SM15]|uniref:M28 family peptidase n=1 Tax=Flavobacterium sp. SM15 TaxID=2908005 RepID=UPI001EDC67A7|nr:M28 family peptidase [Flavobacterium sp. SM15]MCG2611857.1 M28 family peptidase [Flavobacterium sp. SM15]